jgi:ketosteroid isomerase-like protein
MTIGRDERPNIVRLPCTIGRRTCGHHVARAAYRGFMTTAVEVTDRLYARWNNAGLSVLADSVDPAVELICDPLRPTEALRGFAGWSEWVARWERHYEGVHVTVDGLVPVDAEHVLAFVSISATPTGAGSQLSWAAAHLWTLRDGRIAGWEPHLDLAAARRTLDA